MSKTKKSSATVSSNELGKGGLNFYTDYPYTAAKSFPHACKMGSFSSGDLSKLKGVDTKAKVTVDREAMAKNAVEKNKNDISIDKIQLSFVCYKNMHALKVANFAELASLPEVGEQYRIVTQQQINAFSLIQFVAQQRTIDEMYVTVYSINERTIMGLFELMDTGTIGKLAIVIAESMRQLQPQRVDQLRNGYAKYAGRLRIAFLHNHSKISAMRCGNNYFVVEGSGNFSENASIEQYVFENNRDAFEHHQKWIENVILDPSSQKTKRHEILN
jgi:hypothetical protein